MKVLPPEIVHKDHRRQLVQLLTKDIKQVNFYDTHKGTLLGDHYHKETYEHFYIVKGSFIMHINNKKQVVSRGDFFVVEPTERHIIECLSPTGSFFTFLTKAYTAEDTDTYKE